MRILQRINLAALGVLICSLVACNSTATRTQTQPTSPELEPITQAEPESENVQDPVNRLEDFDAKNFDDSTKIDNPWYPMKPGTRWVFDGSTEDSGLTIPHRIVFTVTNLTKVIEGVRTVVAYVEDYSNKDLVEAELAFYAQDAEGNVWYFGEYPEEYEEGKFVDAPAWIAGLKGAQAGIKMKAEPKEDTPSYSQGWGPAVNWTDYGQIEKMGEETCVPLDCYQDVLVITESSIAETDAFQVKYYAKGVGEVRVGWRGSDATKENLELVQLEQLDAEELDAVRQKAFEMEQNAMQRSKEVYAMTSPLE